MCRLAVRSGIANTVRSCSTWLVGAEAIRTKPDGYSPRIPHAQTPINLFSQVNGGLFEWAILGSKKCTHRFSTADLICVKTV